MSNQCVQCGIKFVGRKDKLYCSDYCRSAYHNSTKSDESAYVRSINKILRKNRQILESLLLSNKKKLAREKVLEEGFNFNYFTSEYVTKSGKVYRYCYEYGYVLLNDDKVNIVEKKEYVD